MSWDSDLEQWQLILSDTGNASVDLDKIEYLW